MTTYHPPGRANRQALTALAVAALITSGLGACGPASEAAPEAELKVESGVEAAATSTSTPPPRRPEAGAGMVAGDTVDGAGTGAAAELPAGIVPTRVEIPAIGVDATVIELDIRGSKPEVPDDFAQVGWYGLSRQPGEIGPAVLAGHIDSRQGPAVFYRLDELVPGDRAVIHSSDGETRTFEVTDTGQYPKVSLPDEVFGFGDSVPELRLITCGGTFDRSAGHYRDNFVVYARQVS